MNDIKISKSAFDAWYDSYDMCTPQDPFDRWLARKAWDAAMQSPEVQALRKEAERYWWLRNQAEGWYIGTAYDTYNDFAGTGERLDAAIDAAMEKQK